MVPHNDRRFRPVGMQSMSFYPPLESVVVTPPRLDHLAAVTSPQAWRAPTGNCLPAMPVIVVEAAALTMPGGEWAAFQPWNLPVPHTEAMTADVVYGDILCDAAGRLYERRQSFVRPLFDATPVPTVNARPQPKPGMRRVDDPSAGRRLLRWGDFKDLLSSQLAHPDRLRDSHLLRCLVQVFEAIGDHAFDTASARLLAGAPKGAQLHRLHVDLAVRLSLEAVLAPDAAPGAAGIVRSGERLLRVDLIEDPTTDRTAQPAASEATNGNSGQAAVSANKAPEGAAGTDASQGAPGKATPQPASAAVPLRRSVPAALERSWEFRFTREEASWHARREAAGAFRVIRRLLARLLQRGDRERWRELIAGRAPDEQLWSVRPPRGAWVDPVIRQWARAALATAGYDADAMLPEWELFWRRKGC